MMRKLVSIVAVGVVGVIGLVIASVLAADEWRARRLPTGGTVRLLEVTVGSDHRVTFPSRSWMHHYKKVFTNPRSQGYYSALWYRPHGSTGGKTSTPSTTVWFLIDSPGMTPFEATLVTAAGTSYSTKGANGASTDGFAVSRMEFPIVLPSEKYLNLDVQFHGAPYRYKISNPAYVR